MVIDMKANKALVEFLKDWLKWAEAGAPSTSSIYNRGCGLCANYRIWLADAGYSTAERSKRCSQFFNALGSVHLPFNSEHDVAVGLVPEYVDESDRETIHKNPLRLKWVREYLEQHDAA